MWKATFFVYWSQLFGTWSQKVRASAERRFLVFSPTFLLSKSCDSRKWNYAQLFLIDSSYYLGSGMCFNMIWIIKFKAGMIGAGKHGSKISWGISRQEIFPLKNVKGHILCILFTTVRYLISKSKSQRWERVFFCFYQHSYFPKFVTQESEIVLNFCSSIAPTIWDQVTSDALKIKSTTVLKHYWVWFDL